MNKYYRLALIITTVMSYCVFSMVPVYGESQKEGQFIGGVDTEYPSWFKDSFLDLKEDIEEAAEEDKRLMLIFYQDGCPYCNALIERNFSQKEIVAKAKKHFDIIAINIWGDRELTSVDGTQYTEKSYSKAKKVQFTPTVIFFDEMGKVIFRINGYHAPQRFNLELDYISKHLENKINYREFMKANWPQNKANKKLNTNDIFNTSDLDFSHNKSSKKRPFAVFFEQQDCPDCDFLHTKVLVDNTLRNIIKNFDNTQLDMWSNTSVVTTDGEKTTAREWAKKLNIKYAPSVVIFNEDGKEIIRSEAFFKIFHTQGMFHYVLSKSYEKEPNFQRFLTDYADHYREQGSDVDIWRTADKDLITPIKKTPAWIFETEGNFEEVKQELRLAIEEQGMVISYNAHSSDMFKRTAASVGQTKQVFKDAESLFFCKADLSHNLVNEDPHSIIFCPYTIAIYELMEQPGKIYLSFPVPPENVKGYETILKLLLEIISETISF